MNLNSNETPRSRLHLLLHLFIQERIDAETFCKRFEHTYNLELNKDDLSDTERFAFSELFNKVVWFSPFPEERARIPNYIGEEEVKAAVNRALSLLGSDAS